MKHNIQRTILSIIWTGLFMWGILTIEDLRWLYGFVALMIFIASLLIGLVRAFRDGKEIDDENMEL